MKFSFIIENLVVEILSYKLMKIKKIKKKIFFLLQIIMRIIFEKIH